MVIKRTLELAMKFAAVLKEKGRFVTLHGTSQPQELATSIFSGLDSETYDKYEYTTFTIEDVALFYTLGMMYGVKLKEE